MPELPEVERAAQLLRDTAVGKRISEVQTNEDTIIYSGTTHREFASAIRGRTVTNAGRYGKVMYLELDGDGPMPVLHFGMTGMLQIKGEKVLHYREAPKKQDISWPPRFMKFVLHLADDLSDSVIELAFLDARRLGRIRLCASPLKEPPISELGFDPILCMPSLEDFKAKVQKRTCPIKALLLDQSFSAGVGNWVADEILYHARVHPEERCNNLTEDQLVRLHEKTSAIPTFAVGVNADDSKFPEDWLFKHRWGKGKGKKKLETPGLMLPSGEAATIKFLTVGGRTSAYVTELQQMNSSAQTSRKRKPKAEESDGDSDLTPLSEEEDIPVIRKKRKTETVARGKTKKLG